MIALLAGVNIKIFQTLYRLLASGAPVYLLVTVLPVVLLLMLTAEKTRRMGTKNSRPCSRKGMCSKVNEKRKSKLLLTLFALGITLTLCGCMKSVELKERTIIRMVGVDVDGQDADSAVAILTDTAEKISSRTQVVQTRGSSISDAIDEVSRYSGNEVFLDNSSFLVVGPTAAELGLEKVLNFFNANHEVSPELYVAMAQGEAAGDYPGAVPGRQRSHSAEKSG